MAQYTTIEDEMVQAADHGSFVLGDVVRNAMYQRIESTRQVKREEIPEKLESFHEALRGMLGAGAKVIEKRIAKNLYNRMGLNLVRVRM
jgi:hypothetical protein